MSASPNLIAYASRIAGRFKPLAVREPTAVYNARPRAPARILVVSNDPETHRVLIGELNALGLDPLPVADSQAALNAIDFKDPDLILMALEGPDEAVYQAVLRLGVANLARRAHIPLVAVVGQGGESWCRALDSWLDGVLRNPLRPEELYATLARWLDLPPPASQAPDEPLPPPWCRACIDVDVQEYERALARQDISKMVHFAHRAKGAALVLHADQAAALADRLELAARGYAPLPLDEIQRTLAALKVAIARHFDQADDTGGGKGKGNARLI
ncbi:Hpt domain-containing response regulator [Dyella flagellata]|uniref:Response regulatory domain-containing protein n=1 Tax=Dyella flagellata TaxID=1867833 RepID=A0ABQ5X883_9GAMM|nr:Hpt domain-containing protein [Dyella flagellata]GLQ87263.1 hypothetical protein GCM10007898_08290 [Dyella flagellata]